MCRAYINHISYWKNLTALLVRKDCKQLCLTPWIPLIKKAGFSGIVIPISTVVSAFRERQKAEE